MKPRKKPAKPSIVHQPVAQLYDRFVAGIKQRIRTAQIKAALAGYSARNLKYMRAFAEASPARSIVHQLGAQLPCRIWRCEDVA